MTNVFRAFVTVLVLCVLATPADAKGPTLKITITGAGLKAPIEIKGKSAQQFQVWEGAGTFVNGVEGGEGFVIDWKLGEAAEPAAELPRYEVAFHVEHGGPKIYSSNMFAVRRAIEATYICPAQ